MDNVALKILVGGVCATVFLPTALLVLSLNSGSVQVLVEGLSISRFLPETVRLIS